jgi:hypothetical protein
MEKVKKKCRPSVLSKEPYKRRTDPEMIKIITEIHSGRISKRAACAKYGLNRNTLALFIKNLQFVLWGIIYLPKYFQT